MSSRGASASTGPPAPRSLDAHSLRGLAHPLRIQILTILGRDGPATSTRLAGRLQVRTGTTSWHLRKLAEHEFIEELPGRGNRRERWWRAATSGWTIDGAFINDPELTDATRELLGAVVNQHMMLALEFIGADWPKPWRRAAILNACDRLVLDPEALVAMRAELWAVVGKYLDSPSERADAEPVVFQMYGFPYRRGGTR